MKLTELQKQITPLPWGVESVYFESTYAFDRAYGIHAANVMPELVAALREISFNLYNNQDMARCREMAAEALAKASEVDGI